MKSMVKTLVLLALAFARPALTQAQIPNFQHIVIIYQENRSPDNLFQGLCGPNHSLCPSPYNLQNFGTDNKGQTVPLIQVPLASTYDPTHTHAGFLQMCHLDTATNQCKMDGLSSSGCSAGTCGFEYVNPSDVAPYVTLAQQYGWANFMFQTNQGASSPAHQFIFGGTSAPSAWDDSVATFVTENPAGLGCLSTLNRVYKLISPQTAPKEFNLINNPLGTPWARYSRITTRNSAGSITLPEPITSGPRQTGFGRSVSPTAITHSAPGRNGRIMSTSHRRTY
jgi:hypothetical protein